MKRLTVRSIILSIFLTAILAASNTYLALKVGFLTSASIPAAILSMGILRLFKNSHIHENNLVQTAASAGEAVAGGIAFTAPALIMIHYWQQFKFLDNFFIALLGGMLGIIFSIPLRRILVNTNELPFPEGKAIAAVLQSTRVQVKNFQHMLFGIILGGLLDFGQSGLNIIGTGFNYWMRTRNIVFGFAGGFSIPLIGAGYLMGIRSGVSIFLGAVLIWGLGLPLFCAINQDISLVNTSEIIKTYSVHVHDIGIGALVIAGIWMLILLIKDLLKNLCIASQKINKQFMQKQGPHEKDLSYKIIFPILIITSIFLAMVLAHAYQPALMTFSPVFSAMMIVFSLLFILIIGFLMSVICSYFSALVGVSASPGSSVIIISVIAAAFMIRSLFAPLLHTINNQALPMAAITILIGCVVTAAACIANDNTQDLKVGHIIGTPPWQQQIMLMIGVVVAACVVPFVMNILFKTYGIADVLPRAGMDASKVLAVPPAAMMAAIVQSVFNDEIPWIDLIFGGALMVGIILINCILKRYHFYLSILGVAIGIYLPLPSSVPMCIGAFIALLTQFGKQHLNEKNITDSDQQSPSVILACGLVAGASLVDVIVAFLKGSTSALDFVAGFIPKNLTDSQTIFEWLSVAVLILCFYLSKNKQSLGDEVKNGN